MNINNHVRATTQGCSKQFWKAGEFERTSRNRHGELDSPSTSEFEHARMHPKFLHSNATSHKWALGAFAELLDNAVDEVKSGATYVNVDVLNNKKDGSRMLLIEDNGGGMDPKKMRNCMSLGYSDKASMANTIGQYGNGFKTSTMRLGADVIVFSRTRRTQSIGLLSYTFLRSTGKEDIVVPMLDYEKEEGSATTWTKMLRCPSNIWNKNMHTILEWSPFESEEDLIHQFSMMEDQGTRIIIYNLWENDEGKLEIDLDADCHDIQMQGVNRDEKNIQMAKQYPNSLHFLTYRHSLRSYAAILYLKPTHGFRIILRGKVVKHHDILKDIMSPQEVTYKPKPIQNEDNTNTMVAKVTLGFVKDAENHLDVQGFNVYHKNRLITPFWRVWNSAGSDGRGVIGVIEANFINPAHDKQAFEHTVLLKRLTDKLREHQKAYWNTNCHNIGYAPRRNKKAIIEERRKRPLRGSDSDVERSSSPPPKSQKVASYKSPRRATTSPGHGNENVHKKNPVRSKSGNAKKIVEVVQYPSPSHAEEDSQSEQERASRGGAKLKGNDVTVGCSHSKVDSSSVMQPRKEKEENVVDDLMKRCRSLEAELQKANKKFEELKYKHEELRNENECLIEVFRDEIALRNDEVNNLKKKLRDASNTNRELVDEIDQLKRVK